MSGKLSDYLFHKEPGITLYCGDCREVLPLLDRDDYACCCVTSPPYWQLRSYGDDADELGAEREPETYAKHLVSVLGSVRDVMHLDGALWLNLADSYAASGKGGGGSAGKRECWSSVAFRKGFRMPPPGYKMKDLTLVPFQTAAMLRDDGWYLRSVIVWSKPSATEPMRLDRPAVSHEYLFLLSKSEHYGVRDPGHGWGRSVWEFSPASGNGHPAVLPTQLAARCIAATDYGAVLDPFAGSGTVLAAAKDANRRAIGIELNEKYCEIAVKRLRQEVLPL